MADLPLMSYCQRVCNTRRTNTPLERSPMSLTISASLWQLSTTLCSAVIVLWMPCA